MDEWLWLYPLFVSSLVVIGIGLYYFWQQQQSLWQDEDARENLANDEETAAGAGSPDSLYHEHLIQCAPAFAPEDPALLAYLISIYEPDEDPETELSTPTGEERAQNQPYGFTRL
jgi:hypothetical protein